MWAIRISVYFLFQNKKIKKQVTEKYLCCYQKFLLCNITVLQCYDK